jgi:hypothetical protein
MLAIMSARTAISRTGVSFDALRISGSHYKIFLDSYAFKKYKKKSVKGKKKERNTN